MYFFTVGSAKTAAWTLIFRACEPHPKLASMLPYSHRVTYADCTLGNHVYYARYLQFLEAARGDFFGQLGTSFLQWQEQDTIFPVIECRLRYKAQARYDDVLAISTAITLGEKIRLNFAYRIVSQTKILVLEAETFHICTSIANKPK